MARDTVYDSHAETADSRRFLKAAAADLVRAPAVGWHLFRSGLATRYRRSFLGYLWLVLPALATTATCAYLASHRVIAVPATGAPYPLFVLCGVCLWQVFVEALNSPLQELNAQRQLITRSRAPHEAVVLAGAMSVALNSVIRLVLVILALVAFGAPVGPSLLLAPIGLLALILLGLALGLVLAPFGLLYDDVGRGLTLVIGFGFFLTPIIYPEPAGGLLRLNPVTPILSSTRSWLLSEPADHRFILIAGLTLAGLVVSWLAYRIARPHLVARLG